MSKNKGDIPLEVAQKIIIEAQQAKIKECSDEINKVLDKHGFRLEVRNQIVLLPK